MILYGNVTVSGGLTVLAEESGTNAFLMSTGPYVSTYETLFQRHTATSGWQPVELASVAVMPGTMIDAVVVAHSTVSGARTAAWRMRALATSAGGQASLVGSTDTFTRGNANWSASLLASGAAVALHVAGAGFGPGDVVKWATSVRMWSGL